MALRRLASVAPAVATRCTFTAAAASGTPAPQHFYSILEEIRKIESKMDTMGSEIRSEIRSEMKELDSKMGNMETRIRGLHDGWFRSNERIIYASIAAGFASMGMISEMRHRKQEARHLVELKAVESLAETRTRQALVAGAMSGEVISNNKNVEGSAKHSLPFLR